MVQFSFHDMTPSPWYDPIPMHLHGIIPFCESLSIVPFMWYDSNDMWDKDILAVLPIGGFPSITGQHRGLINYMKDRNLI